MKIIDFMGNRKIAMGISVLVVFTSLVIIGVKGIEKNVDFAGGSKLTVLFRESNVKAQDLRSAIDAFEKGATVSSLESKDAPDRKYTIKIKSDQANSNDSDVTPERRQNLDQAIAGLAGDAKEPLTLLAGISVEDLTQRLTVENIYEISDTDEVRSARYAALAASLKAKLDSAQSLRELAKAVDPADGDRVARGLELCYPAMNRTTRAQLSAFLTRFNPLSRATGASYEDIAEQVLTTRAANGDFFTNTDFMSTLKVAEGENLENLSNFLKQNCTLGSYRIDSIENFSASIAAELLSRAWESVVLALMGILLYLWARFSLAYGVAAVVALAHDVIISLGVFSLFGVELSNPVVAAFLTIVGYSLNDTIVVFDRIREDLGHRKGANVESVLNRAINETLSRTIVTSMTTLFVVVIINLFSGNQVLEAFSFPLLVGITVGTYSSIAIAAPLLLLWHEKYKPITEG